MTIQTIPPAAYPEYRLNVMFDSYKWDLQANEQSTISDKVLLLEPSEAAFLAEYGVQLYQETIAMEQALKTSPELALTLGISPQMVEALCQCHYNPNEHVRFMRFDFHPIGGQGQNGSLHACINTWRISEVNSDVPAGYPEASILPTLAAPFFSGYHQYGCFGSVFKKRMSRLLPSGGTIAYLHDTHTVEDYQILHYLGDLMEAAGYPSMYASPEHVTWHQDKAVNIGGIMRYYPVEWMECAGNVDWQRFIHTKTPSCNHPIALLTQSKRLPLVWDALGAHVPAWKALLPHTVCTTALAHREGWILKPAFGRVGEGINIPGTISPQEEKAIHQAAHQDPSQWVAQKMFHSEAAEGLHINVGVFVMDGEYAGMFSRVSHSPRIDEDASEIPILVKG